MSGRVKFIITLVLTVAVGLPIYRQLGIDLCPLHCFVGIPCPACGVTRSTCLLLHGDISGAFTLNPLWSGFVLCAPLLLGINSLDSVGQRFRSKIKRRALTIALFLITINWVYLIIRLDTPNLTCNMCKDTIKARFEEFAGIEKLEGFSIKRLFSDVFKHHPAAEVEELFAIGTERTTPKIEDVDCSWP